MNSKKLTLKKIILAISEPDEKSEDKNSLILWFEKFYGGAKRTMDNDTRKSVEGVEILNTPIDRILANANLFNISIIDSISSYTKNKYIIALKLDKLLTYLNNEYKFNIDTNQLENFKCRDQEERLLKILKYLHSGKKSRFDIAKNFGISPQTLSEDIKILESGFEFLGFEIKMSDLEHSENTYKSKVNPLFYAANMSEIYSLTIGLKLLSKGTVFEHALFPIADKIYQQLSDYAKEVIDKQSKDTDITFKGQDMHFLNTSEFYRDENLSFTYFLKESLRCKITYYDKDSREPRTIKGDLKLSDPDNDPGKKVKVCTKTGDIELMVEEIIKAEKDKI
jgi:hypothetical protein